MIRGLVAAGNIFRYIFMTAMAGMGKSCSYAEYECGDKNYFFHIATLFNYGWISCNSKADFMPYRIRGVADSDKVNRLLWPIYAELVTKNSSILKIGHGIVPARLNNKSMQR